MDLHEKLRFVFWLLFPQVAERVKLSKTRSESLSIERPVLGSEISSIGVSGDSDMVAGQKGSKHD